MTISQKAFLKAIRTADIDTIKQYHSSHDINQKPSNVNDMFLVAPSHPLEALMVAIWREKALKQSDSEDDLEEDSEGEDVQMASSEENDLMEEDDPNHYVQVLKFFHKNHCNGHVVADAAIYLFRERKLTLNDLLVFIRSIGPQFFMAQRKSPFAAERFGGTETIKNFFLRSIWRCGIKDEKKQIIINIIAEIFIFQNKNGGDDCGILRVVFQKKYRGLIEPLLEILKKYPLKVNMTFVDLTAKFLKAANQNELMQKCVDYFFADKKHMNEVDGQGDLPLRYPIYYGNIQMLNYMLAQGASCDQVDIAKHTPLHYVAEWGLNYQVCEIIINNSSNVNAVNAGDKTPLYLVIESFFEELDAAEGDFCSVTTNDSEAEQNCNVSISVAKIFHLILLLMSDAKLTVQNDEGVSAQDVFNERFLNDYPKYTFLKVFSRMLADIAELEDTYNKILPLVKKVDDEEIIGSFEKIYFLTKKAILTNLAVKNALVKKAKDYENEIDHFYTVIGSPEEITDDIRSCLSQLEAARCITADNMAIYKVLREWLNFLGEKVDVEYLQHFTISDPKFYTCLPGENEDSLEWYPLPGDQESNIQQNIMTILCYQSRRHAWDGEKCLLGRQLLARVTANVDDENLSAEEMYQNLEEMERAGDYIQQNISDDSDDEGIGKFDAFSRGYKSAIATYSTELISRSQVGKIFTEKGDIRKSNQDAFEKKGAGSFQETFAAKTGINLLLRTDIVRKNLPADVHRDLQHLNALYHRNELNEETLQQIGTRFFVAQYRGIHYETDRFRKKERKDHRLRNEVNHPLYSLAVPEQLTEPGSNADLQEAAVLLQHQMLTLAQMGSVRLSTISRQDDPPRYDSPMDAMQELYTRDYSGYQQQLKKISGAMRSGAQLHDMLDVIFLFARSAKIPTVSTGDTPYHALRYAYGIKFYEGKEQSRLRPRWNKLGKVERPYSGKVYICLFDPLDYLTLQPNHLVSLINAGKIRIDLRTAPERETTFMGYIPQRKVVQQHIARYPSFHRDHYPALFLSKYGLTPAWYEKYQQEIRHSAPHSLDNQWTKFVLGEHLCGFYESLLIEDARIAAEERNGYLIYRGTHGEFDFVAPRVQPPTYNQPDKDAQRAAKEKQRVVNNKKKQRKGKAPEEQLGWLAQLCEAYNVRASLTPEQLIGQILTLSQKAKVPTFSDFIKSFHATARDNKANCFTSPLPDIVNAYFTKYVAWLERIAALVPCQFIIHSALFAESPFHGKCLVIGNTGPEHAIVYMGGQGFYNLIAKNQPEHHIAKDHHSKHTGVNPRSFFAAGGSKSDGESAAKRPRTDKGPSR